MATFSDYQFPPVQTVATHKTIKKSIFITYLDTAPLREQEFYLNTNTRFIDDNQLVIVLEEQIGHNYSWCKINYNNTIGYIPFGNIETHGNTKPSLPVSYDSQYYPIEYNLDLKLDNLEKNTPVYDKKLGRFTVIFDTEKEKTNDIQLYSDIKQATYDAASLILKSRGKLYDENTVKDLIDNYFSFALAEKFYFDVRPCPTLKVVVHIPAKYIYSTYIKDNPLPVTLVPVPFIDLGYQLESDALTPSTGSSDDTRSRGIDTGNIPDFSDPLVYKSFSALDHHIEKIIFTLGQNEIVRIANKWKIEPDVNINLTLEGILINNFRSDLYDFLKLNNVYNSNAITGPRFNEDGELSLIIDRNNRQLSSIIFKPNNKNIIPLNIDAITFLKKSSIKNETTINYLLKIPIEGSIFGDALLGETVGKTIGELFSPSDSVNEAFKKANQEISNSFDAFAEAFKQENEQEDSEETPGTVIEEIEKFKSSVNKGIGELQNGIDAAGSALDAANTTLDDFNKKLDALNPINSYKEFILNNHYPTVTSLQALPLDLADCLVDNANRVDYLVNVKSKQIQDQWNEYKKDYEKRKKFNEKNSFGQQLVAPVWDDVTYVQDPNLRILLGKQKPPANDTALNKVNRVLSVANNLDWQRFLAEALKCSAGTFSAIDYQQLIAQYQKLRAELEKIAAITVCNPYLLKGLQELKTFKLPILKVKNRNQKLINDLKDLLIRLINDLIILAIRQLLTGAIKDCLSDKRPDYNNKPNNFDNQIENASNDPAIDNLLDDLFNIKDKNGNIDPAAKENAKEKLKDVMADILPCLSALEICKLLNNLPVNNDVYEIIAKIIKAKGYSVSIGNNSIIIEDLLNSPENIAKFFSSLGRIIQLENCEAILQGGNIPTNILCDDGTLNKLRCELLSDTGLSPDVVNLLLNDLKDQETKNLNDVMKFLDSPNQFPFNLDEIPLVLCKNGKPPLVDISPDFNSFKKLTNNIFSDIYDTFDTESIEWYKSTYSISGTSKNFLTMSEDGSIKALSRDQLANSLSPSESQNASTGSQEFIPSYLFKDILDNNKIFYDYKNNNIYLKTSIDAYLQQQLDINVIQQNERELIDKAENSLSEFLGLFMPALTSYGLNSLLGTVSQGINKELIKGNNVLSVVANTLSNVNRSPFLVFLKQCDAFMKNNLVDINNPKISFLNGDKTSAANALLFANEGAPVLIGIMEYINNNQGSFNTLLNNASNVNLSGLKNLLNSTGVKLDFTNTIKPSDAFVDNFGRTSGKSLYQDLNDLLTIAKSDYERVKSYYKSALNIKITYPNFDISASYNLTSLKIGSIVLNNINNGTLSDFYEYSIKKNSKNYINIKSGQNINNEIYEYITSSLNINTNISKEAVYSAMLNKYGDVISQPNSLNISTNSNYDLVSQNIFSNIKNNIKDNSIFLKLNEKTISNVDFSVPYASYYKLVLPTTSDQKKCGVRPHYLDIDDIKNEIIDKKDKSQCGIEEIRDTRIENNLPINTSDLSDISTNETQNIIQSGLYKLAIRTFLHDILLRGISTFAVYDPQSLRNDALFVDFMADLVESEMRGMDNNYFELLSSFLIKQYTYKYKVSISKKEYKYVKRKLFRESISNELRNHVLPKMAKRLDKDTFDSIKEATKNESPVTELKLINVLDSIIKMDNIIKFNDNSVYILYDQSGLYKKIYQGTLTGEALKNQFRGSIEFKTLFQYVFPTTKYLTHLFITNSLCTLTRKQVIDSYRNTKKAILRTTKSIITNGQPIIPDPNNFQDLLNEDGVDYFKKFIFEAIITTPIKIFKAFIEGSEPNIALSSTIYRVTKQFVPETPSVLIPTISLPLGLIPTPLTCLIPFTNPILSSIYMATLLWYESSDDILTQSKKFIDQSSKTFESAECVRVNLSLDDNVNNYYNLQNGVIPRQTIIQQQNIDEEIKPTASVKNNPSGENEKDKNSNNTNSI